MRKLEERGGCIIPFGAMYACIESKYIYIYIYVRGVEESGFESVG